MCQIGTFVVDRRVRVGAAIASHAGNRSGWRGKEADPNDAFDAIDAETGEPVRINGWMIDSITFDQAGSVY